VLPSSHVGSPRDLQQRYQDAMALVSIFGMPHYFITMTCNRNWPELLDHVAELRKSVLDNPTAVARLFELKWTQFKKDLRDRRVLGITEYLIDTKEDQNKRVAAWSSASSH